MNITRERSRKELCIKQGNIGNIEAEESFNRTLKLLNSAANYNRDTFDKGEAWFNSGLTLEDAPDNFKNDRNFIRGFEKGRRLAFIKEQDNYKKSR